MADSTMIPPHFNRFRKLVLSDPTLFECLRKMSEPASFVSLAVQLGQTLGCSFAAEAVTRALQTCEAQLEQPDETACAALAGWTPIRLIWDQGGKSDIAYASNSNGLISFEVSTSQRPDVPAPNWAGRSGNWLGDGAATFLTGDFNGDGKTDIAYVFNCNTFICIDVYRSTGGPPFIAEHWATQGTNGNWIGGSSWQHIAVQISGLTADDLWGRRLAQRSLPQFHSRCGWPRPKWSKCWSHSPNSKGFCAGTQWRVCTLFGAVFREPARVWFAPAASAIPLHRVRPRPRADRFQFWGI
jgi:hypothetical protein